MSGKITPRIIAVAGAFAALVGSTGVSVSQVIDTRERIRALEIRIEEWGPRLSRIEGKVDALIAALGSGK